MPSAKKPIPARPSMSQQLAAATEMIRRLEERCRRSEAEAAILAAANAALAAQQKDLINEVVRVNEKLGRLALGRMFTSMADARPVAAPETPLAIECAPTKKVAKK